MPSSQSVLFHACCLEELRVFHTCISCVLNIFISKVTRECSDSSQRINCFTKSITVENKVTHNPGIVSLHTS